MESPDPKYKHKPSEKHTLEEVLKSLQDLIRNDLAEGGARKTAPPGAKHEAAATARPATPKPAVTREDFAPASPVSGPVNLDAVLRSLKDLISNELNVGESPAAKPDSPHAEYLAEDDAVEEYVPEELGSIVEGLEDEDIEPPAAPTTESRTEKRPEPSASPPVNVSVEEITLDVPTPPADTEPATAPMESSQPSSAQTKPEDGMDVELDSEIETDRVEPPARENEASATSDAEEEFAPLDDELTIDESVVAPPPPPAASEAAELPGEIDPELLREPETVAAPPSPPVAELPPGTQQELSFDEPAPAARTAAPPTSEPIPDAPVPEPEAPSPPQTERAPEAESAEALPTIEVEEDFDADQYFETDTAANESEESIALDGDLSQLPDAPPTLATDDSGDLITHDAENTPAPESSESSESESLIEHDMDFSSTSDSAPAEGNLIERDLELTPESAAPAPEPAAESPASPSTSIEPEKKKTPLELAPESDDKSAQPRATVDFDTLESAAPVKVEAPASTPPPAQETPAAPGESATSPPAESPDTPAKAASASTDKKTPPKRSAKASKPATPAKKSSKINLDDIPVLHEVAAAPPGSILAPPTPMPLPAPDRARDIVVRAVAKLNIELRKSGGTGLDTRTILRLQQLIRQELEKDSGK